MALTNHKKNEIQIKIVYYGPGRSGKTTNLEYISKKLAPRMNSKMVTIKTFSDRTLFFDFLPIDIGMINGFRLRIRLYTIPGQINYDATRKLVLRGVDGIVFVADTMAIRREKNTNALMNLIDNLSLQKKQIEKMPLVFQYNKIDLKSQGIDLTPVKLLNHDLNRILKKPAFPACAIRGINVLTTLKKAIHITVESFKEEFQ